MGIFDKLKLPWRRKGLTYGAWYSVLVGDDKGRDRLTVDSSYEDYMRLGYAKNATVRACTDLIARGVASVDMLYYRDKGGKSKKALDAAEDLDELDARHPVVELMENPNPDQSRTEWRQEWVMHTLFAGNAYCLSPLSVEGERARKTELWWLHPDAVEPQERKRIGDPKQYIYRPEGGESATYGSDQLLHIKAGGTGLKGVAPATAAAEAISQNNAARQWNGSLLRNDGRPGTIGKWKGQVELTEEQLQEQARTIAPFFRPENSGKFLFTQFTDFDRLSLTPEEMGYIEGLKESMREICRAFRVPSQLLGDTESSTYSNYQEARKSLYHEVIIPYSEMLAQSFQRWFRAWEPGLLILPDTDNIEALQEDANARFERANNASFLTVDERRLTAGWDPVGPAAGGNMILVAAGLIPLDQVALAASYTGDVMPEAGQEEAELTEGQEQEDEDEAGDGKTRLITEEELRANYRARIARGEIDENGNKL